MNMLNMRRLFFYIVLLSLASCAYRPTASRMETNRETAFHEGIKAYYQGDHVKAEQYFTFLYEHFPSCDAACFYLSSIAQERNRHREAIQWIEKALNTDEDNYWYQLRRAKLCAQSGNRDIAIKLYEDLYAAHPEKLSLQYDLIALYSDRGLLDEALEMLDKIEERIGKQEQSLLTRINLMGRQGKEQMATDLLISYAKEYPSPRILSMLGDYYMGKALEDKALKSYQAALDLDKAYPPARYGMAEVYRFRRQYDKFFENANVFLADPNTYAAAKMDYIKQILAVPNFVATFEPQVDTLFLTLRATHPADSSLAYMYTGYLAQTDRMEQAARVLERNRRYYPADFNAWNQLAGIYYYMNRWDSLLACTDRAVRLFPLTADKSRVEMHSIRAIALWQCDSLASALNAFSDILKYISKADTSAQVQTHSCMGDVFYRMHNRKKAYREYETVLRYDSENTVVLNNYAYYLCLENRDLEKALQMSRKAIDKEPTNATYLDTYAWILHNLGRYKEAKDVFRQAMAYGGKESVEILNHYGDVLQALGEPAMANVYWKQALLLDSKREDIAAKIQAYRDAL